MHILVRVSVILSVKMITNKFFYQISNYLNIVGLLIEGVFFYVQLREWKK